MFGNGQRKWDVTLAPIFDEQARVVRIIITARDTTEKKLAADLIHESQERYRLIADNVADLVVHLDRDLVCGFVSPACRELLGHEPEELVALSLADIVHPDDRKAFADGMRRLQTSCRIDEFRFRARHTGGLIFGSRSRDENWPTARASSWPSATSLDASRSRTSWRPLTVNSERSLRSTA
jgi:two-component system, NtrC family, sensor kinase